MHEGDLMRQTMLLKPLQEWVDRTEAFVEGALDKPAALRFLDNTGFTREDLEGNVVEETLPDLRHEKYVRELRMRRLYELAQSVKSEDLNPHFKPQDYENYFRTEMQGPL